MIATLSPFGDERRAIARPMPREPPVTIATLPFSDSMSSLSAVGSASTFSCRPRSCG